MCPFLHPTDVRTGVSERTDATRLRIYKAMSADNFALPPIIRLEIGEIIREEYDEIEYKQSIHEQNVLENKGKAGGRGQRTARTRSPRSNPRTPTPDNTIDNRGKGQNKGKGQHEGKGPTPAETMAAAAAAAEVPEEADNRQRDHTSGQDDASDAEIAAPLPADNIEVETEALMIIDSAPEEPNPNDGLPDFGSPAAEVKEEADEVMEEADAAMDAADSEFIEITGADIPARPIVNA